MCKGCSWEIFFQSGNKSTRDYHSNLMNMFRGCCASMNLLMLLYFSTFTTSALTSMKLFK